MVKLKLAAVGVGLLAAASCSTPDRSAEKTASGNFADVRAVPANAEADSSAQARAASNEPSDQKARKAMKMEKLRSGNSSQTGVLETGVMSRPAPENSEYSVSLGAVGLERRVFRDNANISKIEKIVRGKEATVKIYLRSGRIAEIPGENIENIGSIGTAEILRLAGVRPAATAVKPTADPQPAKKSND